LKILAWEEVLADKGLLQSGLSVATIGVFDGLHIGHMELIRRVVAADAHLVSMVVTFRENPKQTTRQDQYAGSLFTLGQKLDCLAAAGMQVCVLIDFSTNFSKLGGYDFISILVRSFGIHSLVIGSDFKCGHQLSTDAEGVRSIAGSMGVGTDIVDHVEWAGITVSSSRIRQAVIEGRMDQAFAMLGRPYTLDLRSVRVVHRQDASMVSFREIGAVQPPPGIHTVRIIGNYVDRPSTVSVSADGLISWKTAVCHEPEFMAFMPAACVG
jgi:riboflavin kinase/FMN adenylyltransferase